MGMRLQAGVLALITAAVSGCRQPESASAATNVEAPAVRIAAMRVEKQTFSSAIAITGTLVSPSAVTVKAETTGRVLRFAKAEGDSITAGEPVVWVDDSHEKLALRQAQSAVQVAEVVLERAKVAAQHAHSEWNRSQNLLKSGGITDRDYKASELSERDSLALVATASAQLEQARTQVALAEKMLHDSVVLAPITGEIQAKLTAEGAYVEPATAVFSVVNNARLELESMIAAPDLGDIHPGQQTTFRVNTFPDEVFSGRVIEVNPAIQAETRSGKVRVRVENRNGRLRAGMFAQGEIVTRASRQAIVVPLSAVSRDVRLPGAGRIFVIENGRARERRVTVGAERTAGLEITSGLAPGEVIAAEESIELAEGVAATPEFRQR